MRSATLFAIVLLATNFGTAQPATQLTLIVDAFNQHKPGRGIEGAVFDTAKNIVTPNREGKRNMSTHLTPEQTKEFVRKHFEDFVNKRNVGVIRKNMTADFYDHDGPGGKPTTGIDGQFSVIGPKGFFVGVFVPSFVVIYCVAANPDGVTLEVVCFQFPKLL